MEIVTAALAIVIIVLVIFSSLFDRFLRNFCSNTANHYNATLKSNFKRNLTIFSIRRNWYILSAPVKGEVRDLRFLDALRVILLSTVIYSHCVMYAIVLPSTNSIFIENVSDSLKLTEGLLIKFLFQNYRKNESMNFISGNPAAIQFFMVFGGFLTAFLFMARKIDAKHSDSSLFIRGIVGRYVRFVPLLLLTILFHSTWFYRLGNSPMWNHVSFVDRQFCRANWWTNLLFLDNYVNVDQKCLFHTWYLAADFWLRILATLFLIQISRKPSTKFWIFSAILGFSAIAFGITVHVNKLEAMTIFPPE